MAVLHEKANSAIIKNAISIILNIFPNRLLHSYNRKTAKQDVKPIPICKGSAPLENLNLPLNKSPLVNKTYAIIKTITVERTKVTFIALVHLRRWGFEAIAVIKAIANKIYAISEMKFPAAKACL